MKPRVAVIDVDGLSGSRKEAETAARGVEAWLARMGVCDKLQDQGYAVSCATNGEEAHTATR